jgi:lipopolysaccharide/colanic/teichoic acid biosynthesis glycosyltransferase
MIDAKSSRRDEALRRALDVALAGAALAATAPLLVVLMAAIRATSPGPACFRQTRIGRDGRPFTLWKLRTMRADAGGPPLTVGDDPRITAIGRWLRRTRLDELPQLWNVVRGDMSLVGPRPEVPRYVALYSPPQRAVLRARPGLTDPATLDALDEHAILAAHADAERAYVDVVLPHKLDRSLAYLAQRTVWTDLGVLVRTVGRLSTQVRA